MFDEYALTARRLVRPVTFRGVGVHTDAGVVCVVHPAAAGAEEEEGVVFHRTDTGGAVAASWRNVAATRLQTVIRSDDTSVATVEHLMSALSALGIWQARVEIDGPELPILDGSAAPFLDALAEASEPAQPGRAIVVRRPVSARSGAAFATLLPFPSRRFDVGIDFADAAIGLQRVMFDFAADDYAQRRCPGADIRPAEATSSGCAGAGYGRGASLDNAVAVDGGPRRQPGRSAVRADEFARHKLLDAVGDLALARGPYRRPLSQSHGGHRLNYALLERLFAASENFQLLPN